MKHITFCALILLVFVVPQSTAQQIGDLFDAGTATSGSFTFDQLVDYQKNTDIASDAWRIALKAENYRETLRQPFITLRDTDGSPLIATTRGVSVLEDGSIHWIGTLGDSDMLQSIVMTDAGASASLITDHGRFEYRPLGNGVTDVFTIDEQKMPPDHELGWVPSSGSASRGGMARKVMYSGTGLTIKVLVLYSSAGASNITTEASTAESLAIDAFGNSDLPFNLDIDTHQVSVSSEPDVSKSDAEDLADGTIVSNVDALRSSYAADVVMYVSSHANPNARGASAEVYATSAEAFVIISKAAFPSLTVAHEIGHLAGGMHSVQWLNEYFSKDYDPLNTAHNPTGLAYVHGYTDESESPEFSSVMYAPYTYRAPYWSSPDIYYGYEPEESPPVGRPVGELPDWDVRRLWTEEIERVTAFYGPAGVLSDTTYLVASIDGPLAVEWHHSETLYADVDIVTESGSSSCGSNCNYFWYERWDDDEAFEYTGINASSFYFTMTWWDGHEFMLFSNHKSQDINATDTHFVDRCATGCGGGAKGFADGDILRDTPTEFALKAAYPNPFNPTTRVSFDVPTQADIELTVFDVLGRSVAVLADRAYESGAHSVRWDASGRASGPYFVVMQAAGVVKTLPIVLQK